jgi:hypothetical protein
LISAFELLARLLTGRTWSAWFALRLLKASNAVFKRSHQISPSDQAAQRIRIEVAQFGIGPLAGNGRRKVFVFSVFATCEDHQFLAAHLIKPRPSWRGWRARIGPNPSIESVPRKQVAFSLGLSQFPCEIRFISAPDHKESSALWTPQPF